MLELENKIREAIPRLKEVDHFFGDEPMTIEHQIKLNDVLEYITQKDCYAAISINNHFYFTNGYKHYFWDLSSVFLADQSDELKRFLNDL